MEINYLSVLIAISAALVSGMGTALVAGFRDNKKEKIRQSEREQDYLKLDLKEAKNLGNGLNPAISNDIEASYDLEAIRNSLYNIFTTRKGQKLLNPLFGGSLDQHLFENITEFKAKILGDSIVDSVSRFENRVRVDSVQVMPMYDENQYYVIFNYTILNIKDIKKFEILFNANNITFI